MKRTMPEALLQAIEQADSVALVGHVNPDGDAIGSMLAMRLALQAMGKRAEAFCQDKVPDNLMFMAGADAVRLPESLAEDERFDLLLALDVSDERRLGRCNVLTERCAHTAQVDHHGTNPMYCEVNEVDGSASATALMVRALIGALNVPLTTEMGVCLYVGISTDTGNFAYSNTTPEAFAVMAELMNLNLPLSRMNRQLFLERSKAQLLLLRAALNSMQFFHDDEIAVIMLSRRDFLECGALQEHADTIVNYGITVQGVKLAVLARETEQPGLIKMSLRALEPYSVAGLASSFGGGGHPQAAGCTMEGSLGGCTAQLLEAMMRYLDESGSDAD